MWSEWCSQARDARGNRVHTGKAQFKMKSETQLETVQGVILDRGDGSYEARPPVPLRLHVLLVRLFESSQDFKNGFFKSVKE